MTKTMQLVLMMGMIGGTAAAAQQLTSSAPPSAELHANLSMLPTVPGTEPQLSVTTGMHAQVKDDLFAGAEKFAQGATEVTDINLDPSTMGMIGRGPFMMGKDGGLASKMNFMVIHSFKYDKPGMYSMDEFEAYSKKLTDGSWNCSIHVRSKTGSTDICSRTAADHETNEMVILSAEPKELTLIHMSGKMSLNDLTRMSGEHDVRLPQEPFAYPEPKAIIVNPRVYTPAAPPALTAPPAPPNPPASSH